MSHQITTSMVGEAAARAKVHGLDFNRHTTHYVAQHLVMYDEQCRGGDYTSAVSAVRLWQHDQLRAGAAS
jgi:hypothetical protein